MDKGYLCCELNKSFEVLEWKSYQ